MSKLTAAGMVYNMSQDGMSQDAKIQADADNCMRDLSWWAASEMDDTCRACNAPVKLHRPAETK